MMLDRSGPKDGPINEKKRSFQWTPARHWEVWSFMLRRRLQWTLSAVHLNIGLWFGVKASFLLYFCLKPNKDRLASNVPLVSPLLSHHFASNHPVAITVGSRSCWYANFEFATVCESYSRVGSSCLCTTVIAKGVTLTHFKHHYGYNKHVLRV